MTGGRVVILGDTGRNFAAGMSGGIAFVYDVKNDFANKCNMEMVELDSINEEDILIMKKLISNHLLFTKSTVADFILKDFDNQLKNFVKVFPSDYKKVLSKKKLNEVLKNN